MKILITGASGFIGLNLSEVLLNNGHTVIMVSRRPVPEKAMGKLTSLPGHMFQVNFDIREAEAVQNSILQFQPEAVVHGAAITPGPYKEKQWAQKILDINLVGSQTLLNAVKHNNEIRLLYLSSGAVYGASAFEFNPLDEQKTPCRPESLYAISKYAAERLWLRYGQLWGLNVHVARVGAVFGRWERDTGVRKTLSPMLQTVLLFREDQEAILPRPGFKDWIYGRDCGQALALLLKAKALKYRIYNISSGNCWSVLDWCDALKKRYPDFRYRLAEHGEKGNVSLHSSHDRFPLSIKRLLEDSNFKPTFGLPQSQDDYFAWLSSTPGYI